MVKLTENLVLGRSRAPDLESVRKLNCWGSDLDDISILKHMPNVEVVSLSVNKITSLADFAYCSSLQELYIRRNMISNLADICYLKHLPNLRILWLSDNPCAVGDRYRLTVLKTLPNLHKLDNIAVQQEELNDAIEQGLDIQPPEKLDSPSKSSSQRPRSARKEKENSPQDDPDKLTLEQTNKIREELGLKPVPTEKFSPVKHHRPGGSKARQANLLQAALCLVKELDADSLEAVGNAVRDRLEAL